MSASVKTPNGKPPVRTVVGPYSQGPGPAPDKIVPFNIEAEEAVLGSLLLDAQAIVNVASFLRASDFYRETNRWVYEAAEALYTRREAIDFLTVGDEMDRVGTLTPAGGRSFLTSLLGAVPTSIHIEYYARIVERASVRRRLIGAASDIATYAYAEADEIETTIQKAQDAVLAATQRQINGAQSAAAVLEEMWKPQNAGTGQVKVLSTGFPALDRLTTGLRPGELDIFAGRPGMGKSAILTSLAADVGLVQGEPVLYASQEMTAEALLQRQVAVEAQVDLMRLIMGQLDPDEYQRQLQAESLVYAAPLHYFAPGLLTVDTIRAEAIKLKMRSGLALVLVDYIQLIARTHGDENLPQAIGKVTQGLKALAMELKIPVVAASQINREVERTNDKRPTISMLGWSGAIEQDADKVMLLYRPRYYDPTSQDYTVEVNLAKHRNGPTGVVKLYYHEAWTKFSPL